MIHSDFGTTYVGVSVHVHVDVVRDRHPLLLGDLPKEPGGPGQQREPAQQAERQAEVGEDRAAHPGAVQRQRPAEHLRVDPADRLEQAQVRAAHPLFGGDLDQPRGARVADLVHWVAQAGDELLRRPRLLDRFQRERVIASVVGRDLARRGEHRVQVLAAVLGHPEEPRAAAEDPRGDRALQRVRRRQVREPGGDGGRREAVVGERDEHRLEDAHLGLGRAALSHHPQRQLAETDLAHEVLGEVLAEEADRVGVRGAKRGRVLGLLRHGHPSVAAGADSQALISAPCSSSSGGASG